MVLPGRPRCVCGCTAMVIAVLGLVKEKYNAVLLW
jgi:hypothetical protein